MPSVSKDQQMAAGVALSFKRGKIPPNKLRGASKQMARSMNEEQLEDFAETKRKGLPKKAFLRCPMIIKEALSTQLLRRAGRITAVRARPIKKMLTGKGKYTEKFRNILTAKTHKFNRQRVKFFGRVQQRDKRVFGQIGKDLGERLKWLKYH